MAELASSSLIADVSLRTLCVAGGGYPGEEQRDPLG